MLAALGRRRLYKLGARRLMKNPEGRLKVPLLLLFHCPKGRGAVALPPGEPSALPKTILHCPNGSKDSILEEFLLMQHLTPYLSYKVDRDVNLKAGHQEELKKLKNKKQKW